MISGVAVGTKSATSSVGAEVVDTAIFRYHTAICSRFINPINKSTISTMRVMVPSIYFFTYKPCLLLCLCFTFT